jgi:D-arabinose 1-dehydrogenase-like Zn-dependent alcohol dehydrogenase
LLNENGASSDISASLTKRSDGQAGIPRTMRAAVVTGPGQIQISEVARPEPGLGQVRLRLEGCGVCASNLTPWAGPEWMQYPTEPGALGHEAWGFVDAIGEGVEGLSIGDRVAALSYKSYAEYDLAEAGAVVRLPDALAGQPFPGEPLGCAINIYRRSEIETGQTVAIIGIGFLGAILTKLATDAGARVIAISRRPFSLDLRNHRAGQGTDWRHILRPGDRGCRKAMAPRSCGRADP